MANYKLMIPWIKKWEGGYANDPDDSGGCTMMGITIKTFQHYYGGDKTCKDLKDITEEQWEHIFKTGFWDKFKADLIENQSIAELCVQMGWGSGYVTAIKKIQKTLGCIPDGIVGPVTLGLLNGKDSYNIWNKLWVMRYNWLNQIAKVGNNKKFLKGWLRRLNSMKFEQ